MIIKIQQVQLLNDEYYYPDNVVKEIIQKKLIDELKRKIDELNPNDLMVIREDEYLRTYNLTVRFDV